jgi:hypothetical protein
MNDKQSMNTENTNQSNVATGDNVQQTLHINTTHHGISTSALLKLFFGFSLFTVIVIVLFLCFNNTSIYNPFTITARTKI